MMTAAAFAVAPSPPALTTPTTKPRPIFSGVCESMWSWRRKVRDVMLAFAGSDLPAGKRRRDWKAKAHAFAGCGRTVSALACDGCNEINPNSGTIIATCGLRTCPICARRRAEKLRHKLVVAWETMERPPGHELYFLTFTMRYDPSDPDDVSAEGLLRRKNAMCAAWSSVWRQYLKGRGSAACRAIEVGASGMVHVHVLYVGRRPDINVLRARWMERFPDSPFVNVRYCRDPRKAIVELAKYVTKGASPAKASVVSGKAGVFMDPELAVRVEIAFSGDRMVQCYGAWLGITVDDDEDDVEDKRSAAALHAAICSSCGTCGSWHTANYELDEWFERFGDQLSDWKPRIGGSGPRNPNEKDTDHGNTGVAGHIEREQARRIVVGRQLRSVPGWAEGAAPLGEE